MKKIKTKFMCRRVPRDTLRVENIDVPGNGDELYLRMETDDVWKGSVVLNAAQARELARRITNVFGLTELPTGKLWVEL